MELKSFRELLLKKAEDNPTLQTIINAMGDDLIAEKVIESLEKMARPHASMGRAANAAITAFANRMTNKDVEMIRDALSHHVSHYKSALKNNKREVADKHLEKIIPLMHLVARASPHSGGQLGLDYVPLEPWESNYTTIDRRPETGKLIEGTKGLGRRPKKSTGQSKYGISRSVPDYRYLEMPPHGGHSDTKRLPHKGGYPFEEIQVGNPAKIDAREAYLHIADVGPQDEFVPHPFDYHPIHSVADIKQDRLTPDKMKEFVDAMHNWHESEHNKRWIQSLKEAHSKDPEGFKMRGKVKPPHHFEGLKLLDQPDHAKRVMDHLPEELKAKFMKKPEAPSPETPKIEAAPTPKVEPASTPKVETTAAPKAQTASAPKVEATPKPSLSEEHISNLPPALASKFLKRG
jgi:hypothetical protein